MFLTAIVLLFLVAALSRGGNNSISSVRSHPRAVPAAQQQHVLDEYYQLEIARRDALNAAGDSTYWSLPRIWWSYEPVWDCPAYAPRMRVGGYGDGYKYMCSPAALPDDNCVVYSFGSAGKFDFEEHVLEMKPSCEVHTFDPTSTPANIKNAKIQFHRYGLSSSNAVRNIGPVKTLATIMRDLGHTCVDVLKVDVEHSEWPAVAEWASSRPCFRQLLVEVHGPTREKMTAFMGVLESLDMRMISRDANILCASCMEYSFVRYSPERGYY